MIPKIDALIHYPSNFIKGGAIGLALAGALGLATAANAGVIRHDGDPAAYVGLGGSAAYAAVGQIFGAAPTFNFAASATIIAPNWALTAGHVVDQATALTFNVGGGSFSAAEWIAHPKWNGDLGKGYDIGLIRFANDFVVDNGLTPANLYAGTGEIGQTGTAVGFGRSGTGLTGWTSDTPLIKRAGDNVIDMQLLTPGKDNRVLLTDFDNPLNAADSSYGDSAPLGLEYMIAPGDSGGGLFIENAGIWLAGVNSFGWGRLDGNPDSDYGDVGGFTRVSSFVDWITEVITGVSSGGGGGGNGGPPPGRGKNKTFATLLLFDPVEVPEPATVTLFGVGLAAAFWTRRRRRTASTT